MDVDLKMDNNGTETKSNQQENLQRKLDGFKDFQLNPGSINSPSIGIPKIDPSSTLLNPEKLNLPSKTPAGLGESAIKDLGTKNKLSQGMNIEKYQHKIDSVSSLSSEKMLGSLPEAFNVKTILSEKHLKKLRDSLGLKKFDSLFNKASLLAGKKEIGKEDLLQALNKSFMDKSKFEQPAFDQQKVMGAAQDEIAGQFKGFDPLSGKLPDGVLEQLPPLSGNLLDSKYLKAIDSLRKKKLDQQDLKLMEQKVTKDITQAVFKKKPKFFDKAYFDGVLGIIGNDNATIVQASPSLGYHILPLFSLGLGPMISIQKQSNNINTMVGIRSFAKVELFKQRAYLQAEHQISPNQIDYKNINAGQGNFLIGGGVVKSLYGRIAINLSLLYRVNSNEILPGASPWVFRLGMSTVNPDKK